MPNESLRTEFNIDPARFDVVFSQVWDDDENPEDRVHINTEVESEVLELVDDWAEQVHNATTSQEGTDDGLFLVIEGAQATGKTTMTRYIKNELDSTKNPDQANIPIVVPVWDSTTPNPSAFHYRQLIQTEGRRVFEDLDVPNIDEKIDLLNGMGINFNDDQLAEWSEDLNSNTELVKNFLGEIGYGDGEYQPKQVVKELAEDGYFFLFVFDEMVSENDAEEAKSVLKWFKDHLYPYVGLVLFCHPDVSSAIKSEMQDQATRRNIDRQLEIAGETYDIKEDIVINIRGKQHRIVDLEKLLRSYFSEVYIDEDHPEFGPLSEDNIQWMNSLLAAGGLIGNLVDGLNKALKNYADDRAEGDDHKEIGAYLFDECGRKMRHVQIKQRFEAHSELDPNDAIETVWRAKELITQSKQISDLENEQVDDLLDARVLIQDPDSEEIQLNPSLVRYEEADLSVSDTTTTETETTDEIATYNETIERFSDDRSTNRDTLRGNLDIALASILERINSRQINISSASKLTLPGEEAPTSDYVEIVRHQTSGRAEKLEIDDGDLSEYGYRFLLSTLFSDESLNDPQIRDNIQGWFDNENGIILVTNKDKEEITEPDWFDETIDRQRWRDNEYTWGDITQIVHVNRLRELHGLFQHLQELDPEDDSEAIAEIERLSDQSQFPALPDLYEMATDLYLDSSKSIRDIHDSIYNTYNGPTIREGKAFAAVLEEVKDKGFISDEDLDDLRDDYGVEIESLIEKGALKKFSTEDRNVIYLEEDFGGASKISRAGDVRDLFPVGPEIFELLEEFQDMESDRITRSDDEISNRLESLEQKIQLIDFFLYEEDTFSNIQSQIENSGVGIFEDVLDEIADAQSVDEEDFKLVKEQFESDQDLWSKVQDLDVDDDISPIHRELFYAKLPEQPPNWAEDYIDDERQYPDLIYDLYKTIQEVLEELNSLDKSVSEDFEDQSGDLEEFRSKLENFVGVDTGSNGEDVELNDSNSEELTDLSNGELREFEYDSYISDIAENESKRSNLTSATSLLTRVDNIRQDFVNSIEKESLDEINHDTASEYTDVGKQIAQRLLEDEVLFDDDSDEPEWVLQDFQKFCNQIKKLIQESARQQKLEQKEAEQRAKVESVQGEDIDAKIEHLEKKQEDLDDAERYLKLKEEHCEVCKSDWEDLSPERKEEIEGELDRMRDSYPDVDFSMDSIEEAEEEAENMKDTADDVKTQLKGIQGEKDEIDLSTYSSELGDLREKYASD
jgi:hypothetical protein